MSNPYVIVIGRQFGSGGRVIGEKLAAKLGIPLYDKSILEKVAAEQNVSDERLRKMDEYLNGNRLRNMGIMAVGANITTNILYETDTTSYLDRDKVFVWQSNVIKKLAEEGPCIIVGRCADYVLRDHPNLISLFITAPIAAREARIRELHPYHVRDHFESHRDFIIKTDRLRSYYYNYHTDRKWGKIDNYDLVVNSSVLGIDGTADMLADYIKFRTE